MKNQPIIIERVYNAPVARVWKAITNREEMKQWYFELDKFKPEVGFKFQFAGQGAKGEHYLHLCEVKEVIPSKKLSYSWRYEGFEGNSLLTLELLEEGDKTRLRLTHAGIETFPAGNPDFAKESFKAGWEYITAISLKKFVGRTTGMTKKQPRSAKNSETYALTLPSDTEIFITRTLDAPREKVWRVITDPALIPQWWGPRGHTTVVDVMDVRVGGRWRFLLTNREGIETAFNGVYKEITPPEEIINTFEFEPMAGHITIEHVTLTAKGKKTLFTNRIECMTKDDRDGIVESGMEWGSRQTMDRLEELLEKVGSKEK